MIPPVLKKFVPAEYPLSAVEDEVQGTVTLELDIDETGSVTSVKVLESVRSDLDEAAQTAAKKLKFEPATMNDRPIACSIKYQYRFVLPRNHGLHEAVSEKTPGKRHQDEERATHEPPGDSAAKAEADSGREEESSLEFTQHVSAKRPPRAASDFLIKVHGNIGPAVMAPGRILEMAPGLHVAQHGGVGKAQRIFLRGFDAVHGQDLEITVEGIPVNEVSNIHAQGYADLNYLIPETIMDMRVIEGAYDPRQGDFAVAGSVWIGLGLKQRGLTVKAGGGSFGSARVVAAWGPEGESDKTFAAAEYSRGDGFGPSRSWSRAAAIGQYHVNVTDTTNLRLLVTSYSGRFDSAGVVKERDYDDGVMGFYDTYDPHQGGLSTRHQVLAGMSYEGTNGSKADLAFHAGFRELRLRHDFTGFIFEYRPPDDLSERGQHLGDLTEQFQSAVTVGGNGSYTKQANLLGGTYGLEIGFNLRHDIAKQSQRRLRAVDQQPYWDEILADLSVTDIGLYFDLELRPFEWLRARGGVRFDTLSFVVNEPLEYYGKGNRRDAQGSHIGPKATIELVPFKDFSLFLSYGNGFRSPYAIALSQGEKTPFVTIHAAEIGTRLELGRKLDASLAAFYTHVAEDMVFDHATGRYLYGDATTRTGVTLSVKSRPQPWWEVFLDCSYTYSVLDETGKLLPYTVPLTLRFGFGAEKTIARLLGREITLAGRLTGDLIGPRPLPYSEKTDTVFLMSGSISVAWDVMELSVEAFNLLDTRWRDDEFAYVSNFHNDQEKPSLVPDRHFTAGRPLAVMAYLTLHVF